MSKRLTTKQFIKKSSLKHGDRYNGNPNIYNSDDINRVNGIKFGQLYKNTIDREVFIKSLGYKIISIWESDFKKEIKNI